MKRIILLLIAILLLCVGCSNTKRDTITDNSGDNTEDVDDETNEVDFILPELSGSSEFDESKDIEIDLSNKGIFNNNGYIIFEDDILYILKEGKYVLYGEYNGRIIIDANSSDVKLVLSNATISSSNYCPILGYDLEQLTITAKENTINNITDNRTILGSFNSAIYATCDLKIKGNGTLNVNSILNNGIHSKKDLNISNLNLNVTAINNALKGNDSITIENSILEAISVSGDTLKTKHSDISKKGKQRGYITVIGGKLDLYAACDAIDASYDVIIKNDSILNCYTSNYSVYSNYVANTKLSTLYIIQENNFSDLKVTFVLEDSSKKEVYGSTVNSQFNQKTLSFDVPSKTVSFVVNFTYNKKSYQTENLNLNSSYDCLKLSMKNSYIKTSWTIYSSMQRPNGMFGGFGGMNDGNQNKSDYSCKGIKSKNEILIESGTININAYDDGIHATYGDILENGETGKGNVYIKGGDLKITTDDDGIHADNLVEITGGNVSILKSYEGIEGNVINLDGGIIEIVSTDDGINAINTVGSGYLYIKSGTVYVNAAGDGLDSNGYIEMTGGNVILIGPSNAGNGVLDFDKTFKMTGGYLLAIGTKGMDQKPSVSNGVSLSVKNNSLQYGKYISLVVDDEIKLELFISKNNMNYIVCAGEGNNVTYNVSSYSSFKSDKYGVTA